MRSLAPGYRNLQENEGQSARDDVSKANGKQAEYMLQAIGERLDAQDEKPDAIPGTVKNEGH